MEQKAKTSSFFKGVESLVYHMDKWSFAEKEKILFYKQLVYMIKGGVSIMQAVESVKDSTDNYALKKITASIAHYLSEGKSFSYALSRLPEYFDEGDAAIIRSGESTGNLDIVLHELANEYSYINQIKNKYKTALTYPIILIIISVAAVLFLFTSVLPGILIMFSDGSVELPKLTLILKGISDFFVAHWINILIVVGVGTIITTIYATTDKGKNQLMKILLDIPLVGQMTKDYYLIKWARYVKLMIGAGLDYLQTFRILKGILNIPIYQEMIDNVMAGLQVGKTIYDSIKDENHLIYSNVAAMIKVGEETANLEKSMENIIGLYQEELDNNITRFAKVIEPIILVFMGAIVSIVAFGVFGVIFAVMENAGL